MKTDFSAINNLITNEQFCEAVKQLNKIPENEENRESLNFLKAITYMKLEKFQEAEKHFSNLSDKAFTKEIIYNKLLCKFKTEKFEDIIKYHILNKNVDISTKFLIAASYDKINLFQNARLLYEEISKSQEKQLISHCFNNLSCLDKELFRFKLALNYSDKSKSGWLEIANNAANGYLSKGMHEESLNLFDEIYEEIRGRNKFDKAMENILLNYLKALQASEKFDKFEEVVKEILLSNKFNGDVAGQQQSDFKNLVRLFYMNSLLKAGRYTEAGKEANFLLQNCNDKQIIKFVNNAVKLIEEHLKVDDNRFPDENEKTVIVNSENNNNNEEINKNIKELVSNFVAKIIENGINKRNTEIDFEAIVNEEIEKIMLKLGDTDSNDSENSRSSSSDSNKSSKTNKSQNSNKNQNIKLIICEESSSSLHSEKDSMDNNKSTDLLGIRKDDNFKPEIINENINASYKSVGQKTDTDDIYSTIKEIKPANSNQPVKNQISNGQSKQTENINVQQLLSNNNKQNQNSTDKKSEEANEAELDITFKSPENRPNYVFKTSLRPKPELNSDFNIELKQMPKDYIAKVPRHEKKTFTEVAAFNTRQKDRMPVINSQTMNKRIKVNDDDNFQNFLFYSFDSELDNNEKNTSFQKNDKRLYKRIKQEKSDRAKRLNNTSLHNINDSLLEKMNIYDNKYKGVFSGNNSYKVSSLGGVSVSTIENLKNNERINSEGGVSDIINDIVIKTNNSNSTINNKESDIEDKNLENLYIKAVDLFKKIEYQNAKEILDKIRKIDKNFNAKEVAFMLGKIYLEREEFKKAAYEFEQFPKSLNLKRLRDLLNCYNKLEISKNLKRILCDFTNNNPIEEDIITHTIEKCLYFSDTENSIKFSNVFLDHFGRNFNNYVTIIKLLFSNNTNELLDYIHSLLDALSILIKTEDDTNEFYYLTGRYMLKKKHTQQAFDYFNKIDAEKMEKHLNYNKYFGKACLILKNYKKAIKLFKKALNIEKSDWEVSLYIGESYLKLDNYEGALKYLTYSMKKDTKFNTNLKLNLSLGRLYYKQKNYMQALDHFYRCTQIDTQCYKAFHHIAMIFLEKREFNEAEKVLEKAYAIANHFFPILFELFKLKCLLKKETECKELIPRIEQLLVDYPMCYLDFAKIILESFTDIDKSLEYFNLALTHDKNIKNSFNINKAIDYASYIYGNLNKKATSYEVLEKLLKINDNNYFIYKKLNQLYINDNLLKKAIDNLLKFVEIDKHHYESRKELADLYFNMKEYSKAMLTYEDAIICFNKQDNFIYTDSYKRLGICEVKLELYDAAIEHLRQQLVQKEDKRIYLLIAYLQYVLLDKKVEAERYFDVNKS
jgi:tetratricopeptide (TPR) repeat protein